MQISPAKKWCLTWNNYPEDWLDLIVPKFQSLKAKYGLRPEVGREGTPHIQGWVEFESKLRPMSLKLPEQIHWEKMKGSIDDSIAYCNKTETADGDYVTNVKPKRVCKFPEFNKWWQKEIVEIIKTEPDNRTIHWYWSSQKGIGKTTFCKWLCIEHNACLLCGKKNDIKNAVVTWKTDLGEYPELCVWNIPAELEGDFVSYTALEHIKDALFYSGKYKGGMVADPCPHVIVFANIPPNPRAMDPRRFVVKDINEAVATEEVFVPQGLFGQFLD